MNKNKIGVFIPVHGNYRYLMHLLGTLKSDKFDIVVGIINNGSDKDTNDYCNSLIGKENYIVENYEEALGVSGAWNRCLDLAIELDLDKIIISNSDVLYHPECIDTLAKFLDDNPDEIVAMPIDLREVKSVYEKIHVFSPAYLHHFRYSKEALDGIYNILSNAIKINVKEPEVRHDLLVGWYSFMIKPKELLSEVGYFDDNFFPAYWEDTDMSWRISLCGKNQGVVVNACVLHINNRSLLEGGLSFNCIEKNSVYFTEKHSPTLLPGQRVVVDGKTVRVWEFKEGCASKNAIEKKGVKKTIYDCFSISTKKDIQNLELRFKILNQIVDYFIIVEPDKDENGKNRDILFLQYQDDFQDYIDKVKIIRAKGKLSSNLPDHLNKIISSSSDEDLFIVSNVCDIPDPRKLNEFKYMENLNIYFEICDFQNNYEIGPRFCSKSNVSNDETNTITAKKAGWKLLNLKSLPMRQIEKMENTYRSKLYLDGLLKKT